MRFHLVASVLLVATPLVADEPDPHNNLQDQANQLIGRCAVLDGNVNYFSTSGLGQPDFRRVKQITGIDFGAITLSSEESLDAQLAALESGRYQGARLILKAEDFDVALQHNEYGILFYSQTHFPLLGDIRNLRRWYSKGLRIFMLQYGSKDENQTERERLGGGTDQEGGLTELGREVVRELIRLGVVIDLSHCNSKTTIEAAAIAKQNHVPVTANHTAARGLRDSRGRVVANYSRNVTDAELVAIKETGGVIGIMAYPSYLLRVEKDEERRNATVDDYVAHIDYVVKKIGVDHVGISTDGYLDGSHVRGRKADGILDSPGRWKAVAAKLLKLSYTEQDVKKILGGNFLRVYREVLK
jgi:membrane dipeptidase